MKNIEQITVIVAIIIAVIIFIPFLIYQTGRNYHSNARVYEMNWKINIQSDFKEIYYFSGPHGFHGDGQRYTIFETKEMPASLFGNPAKNFENKEIESRIGNSKDNVDEEIEQFVRETVGYLKVPEERAPNFDESYIWKELSKYGNEKLVILYFPDTKHVYFVELLI